MTRANYRGNALLLLSFPPSNSVNFEFCLRMSRFFVIYNCSRDLYGIHEDYWRKIRNVNGGEKKRKRTRTRRRRRGRERRKIRIEFSAGRLPIMRIEILKLSSVDYTRKELTEADYSLKRFRLVILFK